MRKNIWLRILSVVLAVVLWFFVISRGYSDVSVIAPVEFVNIPQGLHVAASESTSSVTVGLRGHERIIKSFSEEDVKVRLDLKGLPKGSHRIDIGKKNIGVPFFVRLVNVQPSKAEVVLEEGASKSIPVKPYIVGQPEKGYKIVRIKVVPGSVDVEGGGSELDSVSWLKTEPVDVSGASKTVEREVRVAAPEGIKLGRDTVTVEVAIEKERGGR